MLGISLMRMGAKGKPFYRLVVKERRSKRDGKYLENVGTYNPMVNPAEVILNHDRIHYWISVGAKPTETVASLIKNNPFAAADIAVAEVIVPEVAAAEATVPEAAVAEGDVVEVPEVEVAEAEVAAE